MFCPLCGKRLANPPALVRPDGERSFWKGLVAPSCRCGATFWIEAECERHIVHFKMKGVGKVSGPDVATAQAVVTNCVATNEGDFPEFGLSVRPRRPR